MLDGIKINLDLNAISVYVQIYVFAFIFSLFSLIYNPIFIFYGFITFAYGVIAHIWELALTNIFPKAPTELKQRHVWLLFLIHFILVALWITATIAIS